PQHAVLLCIVTIPALLHFFYAQRHHRALHSFPTRRSSDLMNPFDSRRGPGVLLALAIANQGVDPLKLDTLLSAQLDSMRATGVTSEELTKAKNVFRAGFIHERETALGKAEELHHYDMFHASLAEINSDLDRFLAVTADDIRRVAAKYLDPANALVIIVKPAASG